MRVVMHLPPCAVVVQMDKIAAKEGALLKLRSQSENERRHSDLEIARLTQDVSLWRSTLMHASHGKVIDDTGDGLPSRSGMGEGRPCLVPCRAESEAELLAKLGSQWASTCSLLADVQAQDKSRHFRRGQAAAIRVADRAGGEVIGASVALSMRQMVEDVVGLHQELLLTIAELRLLVCVPMGRTRAVCLSKSLGARNTFLLHRS